MADMNRHFSIGTCAVPRFDPVELPQLMAEPKDNAVEWDRLYTDAEGLIGMGKTQFKQSIRHQLVLDTLTRRYEGERTFQQLPLACKRRKETDEYVIWSSANTVFDMRNRKRGPGSPGEFSLLPGQICRRLVLGGELANEIAYAEMQDLQNEGSPPYRIEAKVFILATGAISNPQVGISTLFSRLFDH